MENKITLDASRRSAYPLIMKYEGTHRSHHDGLTKISDSGIFGGVFASANGGMYGEHVYTVVSERHLTDYALNYEIVEAWEIAVELCRGDESLAEIIMTPGCVVEDTDPEAGFEAQRLRGALAKALEYTSVEMLDECGHSVLCLPGCKISLK